MYQETPEEREQIVDDAVGFADENGMVPDDYTYSYNDNYGFYASRELGMIVESPDPNWQPSSGRTVEPVEAVTNPGTKHTTFFRGSAEPSSSPARSFDESTGAVVHTVTTGQQLRTADEQAVFVAGHELGGHATNGFDGSPEGEARSDDEGTRLLDLYRDQENQ